LLSVETFPVENTAELIAAVAESNSNCSTHTIIDMAYGTYSLTSPTDTSFYGNNGLRVNCILTINGNGAIITRNSGTEFRLIGVGSGATLTLNDITLQNGQATEVGGGGVVSVQGTVHINRSRIVSNIVDIDNGFQILGGGVYSYYGNLTIEESEISNNVNDSQLGDGGGIGIIAGLATITRSDIRNNSTARDGGGIAFLFTSTLGAILHDSEIVENNRISVFANWGADARKNWWGSSQGPLVDTYRLGDHDAAGASRAIVVPDSVSPAAQYFPFKILVVPEFPGVTQEALDMHAVAEEGGLYLHHGPTLNGKRQPETSVPWGDKVAVLARLEFQQEDQSSQVWYQIETVEDETGWIAARMEDKFYVDEVTADIDPCQDKIPDGSDLTFLYRRGNTTAYAVEHSYQNSSTSPGAERVTKRLSNNPFSIPFANFDYTDLAGGSESTGSAMFVSESVWMGGMPMTVGDPDSCTTVTYEGAGWRFCWNSNAYGGNTSTAWEVHKGLGEYYTTATIPIPSGGGPTDVLVYGDYPNKGEQIMFTGTAALEGDRLVDADLAPFIGEVEQGGGEVFEPVGLVEFVRDHLGQYDGQSILKAADYLWINSYNPEESPPGSPHGLVVLGWTTPQICADALSAEYTPNDFYETYSDAFADLAVTKVIGPNSGESIALVVPFVADFTDLQSPIPRPFYCTRHSEAGKENFKLHSWRFYKFPDQVTLPETQIYIDPQWNWTASDGL